MGATGRHRFRLWADLVAFIAVLTAAVWGFDTSAGAGGRPLRLAAPLGAPPEVRGAAHAWLLTVMILTSPLFVEPALQTIGIAPGR